VRVVLVTGFPGFLGAALLPRLLGREEQARVLCLVQARHLAAARQRVRAIEEQLPGAADRVELVEGDVTAPGLGVSPAGQVDKTKKYKK